MKAMILAAGLGMRLRPLTAYTPKPLLPLAGQPIIVWNLSLLRRHGITEVMINVHHLGKLIQETLGDGSQWGMRLSYSQETVLLGTGGGLKQVESFFDGEPFLALNGDTLVDLDLLDMVRNYRLSGALAMMALRNDPAVSTWGVVASDAQDRVMGINGRGMHPSHQHTVVHRRMFAGIHVIDPLLLRDVPIGMSSSIIDAYVAWLENDALIQGYPFSGYWSDIGTPVRYAQAQQDIASGLLRFEHACWPLHEGVPNASLKGGGKESS